MATSKEPMFENRHDVSWDQNMDTNYLEEDEREKECGIKRKKLESSTLTESQVEKKRFERFDRYTITDVEFLHLTVSKGRFNYFIFIDGREGGIPRKRPYDVKREIDRKLKNISIESIRYTKNQQLLVNTQNLKTAEEILGLNKFFGVEVKTRLVRENLVTKFLIGGIDEDIPLKNLMADINNENKLIVIEATRFMKFDRPSKTVLLTIIGNPNIEKIKLCYQSISVHRFTARPSQCRRCLSFGHIPKFCRSEPVCVNCGAELKVHEDPKKCDAPEFCKNCKQSHKAVNVSCERYIKEQEILESAERNFLPIFEARRYAAIREHQAPKRLDFAACFTAPTPNSKLVKENEELREELMGCRKELKSCKDEIAELKEQLKTLVDAVKELKEQPIQFSEFKSPIIPAKDKDFAKMVKAHTIEIKGKTKSSSDQPEKKFEKEI